MDYTIDDFSSSTITWDDSNDNGKIYQLDLIFNYTRLWMGFIQKSLIYSLPLIDDTESKMKIEGNSFFNFLALNLDKNQSIIRYFNELIC